jgi:hypothetical protein
LVEGSAFDLISNFDLKFPSTLLLEYALKKAKHDKPRQARRQAALDRFKLMPEPPGQDPKDRAKYLARKDIELAALKSALGH